MGYKHIDRRSTFKNPDVSNEEQEKILEKILEEVRRIQEDSFSKEDKKFDFNEKYSVQGTNIGNPKPFLINSYYLIGMIDYKIASDQKNNITKEKLKSLLTDRAYLSAGLQYFYDNEFADYIKETGKNGNNRDLFLPNSDDKIEDLPDKWYHGRHKKDREEEVTSETLMKRPEEGDIYHTYDGMMYVGDIKTAEKYAGNEENSQIVDIPAGRDTSRYFELPGGSHGGIPFMFQDEIYDMSKNGRKDWLIQNRAITEKNHRAEAIYIGNFADFVDWRDAQVVQRLNENSLRLPNGNEELGEYIESMDKEKEHTQRDEVLESAIIATYDKITPGDLKVAAQGIGDAHRHPQKEISKNKKPKDFGERSDERCE